MAGSIVLTTSDIGGGVTKYSAAWTSDASGNVNANNTIALKRGYLFQIKFVPTNGGAQPSASYNVTLPDPDGVDLLAGKGAALSNTAATLAVPLISGIEPVFLDPTVTSAVNLTISAAGNTTNGRVDIYVGPAS